MKKILTVSLVAMMAVSAARAEIASKAYVDQQDTAVSNIIGALANLGTEDKSSVVNAINEVNTAVGNVPEQVQADWNQETTTAKDYIKNKPALGDLAALDEVAEANLATALATKINSKADATELNSYELLENVTSKGNATSPVYFDASGVATPITSYPAANVTGLANIATSGNYSDLTVADGAIAQAKVNGLGAAASKGVATTVAEDGTDLPTAGAVYTAISTASAPTNFISQTITDGVTGKAPSEDAVNDALALKANSGDLGDLAAKDEVAESDLASALASKINGKEDVSNKVTSMSGSSTDDEYPSAKAVYDAVEAAKTTAAGAYQAKSTADLQIGTTGGVFRDMTTAEKAALASGIDATKVGQIQTNADDIAAINNASTGILKQAKDYTDTKDTAMDSRVDALETTAAGLGTMSTQNTTSYYTKTEADAAFVEDADIANMQTTTNLSSSIATDTGSTSKYPSVAAVEAAISALDSSVDADLALKEDKSNLKALAYKDTVATADIDANAVTTAKIADDAVTLAKITSTLPSACNGTGAECVLKSSNGAVAWEVIQRATGETPNNTTGSNAQ